jgi:hypothetical protein
MICRSSELPCVADEDAVARNEPSRREIINIRQALDVLGAARCPLCRVQLVARLGRAGPYFACGCPPKELKRAS